MNRETVYLAALLHDNHLNTETIQQITSKFNIQLVDYENIVRQADQLVFLKDSDGGFDSVQNILQKLAGGEGNFDTRHPLTIEKSFSNDVNIFSLPDCYQEKAIKLLEQTSTANEFASKLFHLQRFYLSNIASNGNPATVSLFEHIKSRAAFAQCLFTSENQEHPFVIACCDLSGIQEFVFDIHNSKAYKSIKGRSFYLQLVVESLISSILEKTGMSPANVIYSSGGKFYLLLPNNQLTISTLEDIENALQFTLFQEFQLGLYVCMDWIEFGFGEYLEILTNERKISGEAISGHGDLWAAVSEKAAQKKTKKFKNVLPAQFDDLFTGNFSEDFNGEKMAVCAVSGLPVPKIKENNISDLDDDPIYVHELIRRQTELGKALQRNDILLKSQQAIGAKDEINPLGLGYYFSLINAPSQGQQYILLNPLNENDYDAFFQKYNSTAFLFYGGNWQADNDEHEILTLEQIAQPENDRKMTKIGVLKMDIDGLGDIFTNRMKEEYASFAAMSDLSARLDWFFSGYLNSIRNEPAFKKTVNILYSGGDDLCAVGRWDAVLNFASRVRSDFREYIGGREGISISAGFEIFGPKFPISKAIHLAQDALDEAKLFKEERAGGLRAKEPTKNAIHLLGVSVDWKAKEEWQFVQDLTEHFVDWVKNDLVSNGTVYKLHTFKASSDRKEQDWRWQSAYYFARMKSKPGDAIKNAIYTGSFDLDQLKLTRTPDVMFDLVVLAAKLSDYQTR